MGIATGMKDIVKDITSSTNTRMADVKRITKETNKMLGSFKYSQEKMGARLRTNLAHDKAEMITGIKAARNRFRSSHKEMGTTLKHDLVEHAQGIRSEVVKMRQDIGASHQDMSAKLRKNLDRGAAALKSETHNTLSGFQRSHKQMGTQLRKDLADHNQGIKSEVSGMRLGTIADLKEARTAWQGLDSTIQAKIGGTKTQPKVAAPVPIKAAAQVSNEGKSDLETKMLATISEYPTAGITLKNIASILGVAPVVLGKTSMSLVKKGKIRRENKIYFPVMNK